MRISDWSSDVCSSDLHAGFIVAVSRGRYISGPTLRRLARPENDTNRILVQITAPILAKLSRRTCRVCHLGVLEDGMMTYLIKEGDAQDHTLSRQGIDRKSTRLNSSH